MPMPSTPAVRVTSQGVVPFEDPSSSKATVLKPISVVDARQWNAAECAETVDRWKAAARTCIVISRSAPLQTDLSEGRMALERRFVSRVATKPKTDAKLLSLLGLEGSKLLHEDYQRVLDYFRDTRSLLDQAALESSNQSSRLDPVLAELLRHDVDEFCMSESSPTACHGRSSMLQSIGFNTTERRGVDPFSIGAGAAQDLGSIVAKADDIDSSASGVTSVAEDAGAAAGESTIPPSSQRRHKTRASAKTKSLSARRKIKLMPLEQPPEASLAPPSPRRGGDGARKESPSPGRGGTGTPASPRVLGPPATDRPRSQQGDPSQMLVKKGTNKSR